MPILLHPHLYHLFFFTLFIIFIVITAQQPQPQLLQFIENVATTNLTVELNDSVIHQINLPSTTAILRLEWTTHPITAFPSTLFFLSNTTDSPIRIQNNSLLHNPQAANYTCTRQRPCATISSIDFQSFYTRSTRAFLSYPFNPNSPSPIYVTVSNYDTQVVGLVIPPPPKILKGVLSARLVTDPNQDCPGGIFPQDPVCSDQGQCRNRVCRCNSPFDGTACQRKFIPLPQTNQQPNGTFLTNTRDDFFTTRIDLFSSVVFSIQQNRSDERIEINLLILRGFVSSRQDPQSIEAPKIVMFYTPPSSQDPLATLLTQNVTLPTLGRETRWLSAFSEVNSLLFPQLEQGQVLYIALFAFPNEDMTEGHAIVSINMTTCRVDECRTRSGSSTLELALVPAFLVTTAVAAIGVLVMLWLDRRHGFTSHVDRLSEAEIERMYPNTRYSGETLECSICLCEIEPGDTIRKLQCSHIYHTECLDPWLTENRASCPTCRTNVRVEQLSDKRHMRRIIQFFLAPITAIRRYLHTRRGPDLVEDEPPDLESGDTTQARPSQSNDENNDDTNDRQSP